MGHTGASTAPGPQLHSKHVCTVRICSQSTAVACSCCLLGRIEQSLPPNLPGLTLQPLHVVHKDAAVSASLLAKTFSKQAQHAVVLSLSASAYRTSPRVLIRMSCKCAYDDPQSSQLVSLGFPSGQAIKPDRPRQVAAQACCPALVGHDALCLERRHCHYCYVCNSVTCVITTYSYISVERV